MTFRFTPKTLFGAVAMLSLGASLAAGQDTSKARPRSDRRVPIKKEEAGEVVAPPRVDTVTVYHTDTVQLTTRIFDTVRVSHTRIDTVIPRLPAYHYARGFFGGMAGGFSVPTGSLYVPNSTGGSAQIQLGWLNAKQVLGGRFDWNGSWPGKDSRFSVFNDNANLQNFSLDLKAQYPFSFGGQRYKAKTDPCEPATTYTRGPYVRFAVYGIGGFTYTTYKNVPLRINSFDGLDSLTVINRDGIRVLRPNATILNDRVILDGNDRFFVLGDDDSHSRGGWNAGGGLSMFLGRAELFVEARVIGFKPHSFNTFDRNIHIDASQARQVPVVLGLNWY